MTHLKQGDKPRKITLKEKKAYASGYSQAVQDCYGHMMCNQDRLYVQIVLASRAMAQLLNPKDL